MKEDEIRDELTSIRSLMERSSKFISLSGLSGILAGVYALIGAAFAYNMLYNGVGRYTFSPQFQIVQDLEMVSLLGVALIVLLASVSTGVILSISKAKKNGQPVWGKTSKALLFNMSVPLITGGLLMLILLNRGYYGIIAPSSLIFYGLALISTSNFTFSDVRYLGILEILLGLIAACLPGYGLLFWAVGFGVLHIVYGSVMYFKYDR
jgi:hypothetical protein